MPASIHIIAQVHPTPWLACRSLPSMGSATCWLSLQGSWAPSLV